MTVESSDNHIKAVTQPDLTKGESAAMLQTAIELVWAMQDGTQDEIDLLGTRLIELYDAISCSHEATDGVRAAGGGVKLAKSIHQVLERVLLQE